MLTHAASPGCSVKHVIDPVLGRDKDRAVIVLVAYLDDSGTDPESPVVTMAGYIGGLDEWRAFEVATDTVFGHYGISFFHSKEFHDTKCQFGGWSRIKKTSFIDEWYAAASPFIQFGIGISVQKKTYDLRKIELGLAHRMSAFGFCFNAIIDKVLRSNEFGLLIESSGLSFVVESGMTHNAALEYIFHNVRKRHKLEGRLRSISFADKRDLKAFQLADCLAFHAKRHFVQCNKRNRNIPSSGVLQLATRKIKTWAFFANEFGQ